MVVSVAQSRSVSPSVDRCCMRHACRLSCMHRPAEGLDVAKDWSSLRVTRRTMERVRAMCASLMREKSLGGRALPQMNGETITADALLNWLMDAKEDHRARARKQRGANGPRKGRTEKEGEGPVVPVG